MQETGGQTLYRTLIRAITFAAVMVAVLWFLHKASGVVLLFVFAMVLAIVINRPVAALERRGMKRIWACLLVFGGIFLVLGGIGWMVIPKVSAQVTALVNNLPGYAANLSKNVSTWFSDYPQISRQIQEEGINVSQWLPSVPRAVMQIGNYSVSLVMFILGLILFISMIVYAVANPKPLAELYFSFFPEVKQEKATTALEQTSIMLFGWIKANVIGGAIRAAAIIIFLNLMGVPGAWVWGAVAFFSELIPRLGFYIMAIPPILVGLSVSPMTGFWVLVFMLALDELMGDFILPRLRSNTMNIHPVSLLIVLLAMVAVFGVMGAMLATPITAIIKAYYEAFFRRPMDEAVLEARTRRVLYAGK